MGYACGGTELCALRWRVCDRRSTIPGWHSDLRQPRTRSRGPRNLFRRDDDLLASGRAFCSWPTNDTQSARRIYHDHRARLDVGSYRRSGRRPGARQLEDYLRTYCAVASDCRVLEPLACDLIVSVVTGAVSFPMP